MKTVTVFLEAQVEVPDDAQIEPDFQGVGCGVRSEGHVFKPLLAFEMDEEDQLVTDKEMYVHRMCVLDYRVSEVQEEER